MTTNLPPLRKVRVACQRCRARRIKCDGNTPSCTPCAKAGASCVDVDARNTEQLIPRNTVVQARARIQWLEDTITKNLPNIDLSAGPQVDLEFITGDNLENSSRDTDIATTSSTTTQPSRTVNESVSSRTTKRSHSAAIDETHQQSFQNEARNVALDLGMLSLNSDSREKHYLGSSSGLIFSYLLQGQSPQPEADTASAARPSYPSVYRRAVKHDFKPVYEVLKATMPVREDGMYLLQMYLCHVHPDHPVLHVQSICSAFEALYFCKDIEQSTPLDSSGWPVGITAFTYNGEVVIDGSNSVLTLPTVVFHVFMAFTIAATIRLGQDQNDFGPAKFHRVAMSVAQEALAETSIASLQGIYLMAVHAFMTPAKLNLWTLSYICMAHAIDLGIHRQSNASPASKLIRALIFHCVYSLDRSIATIQGRPLGIRDETFDTKLPCLEEIQTEIESETIPPAFAMITTGTMPYTLHRFKLDRIVSEIKSVLYLLPPQISPEIWHTDYETHQERLHTKLKAWHTEVPLITSQLVMQELEQRRWQLNLELLYHAAIVLLFQPSQVFREPDEECLQLCLQAAVSQVSCYNTLYEHDLLQFDWRTVRSIFACGATIIYCFWTSKAIRQAPELAQISTTLRLCSTLLAVGGIWWPSVKKGRAGFDRLVDLTFNKVNDVQKGDSERARKRRIQPSQTRAQNQPRQLGTSETAQHEPSMPDQEEMQFDHSLYIDPTSSLFTPNQPPVTTSATDQQHADWMPFKEASYDLNRTTGQMGIPDFNIEELSPPQGFSAAESMSSYIDPEIQAFLTDFFLDDNTWNMSDTGPPVSFHFGNL